MNQAEEHRNFPRVQFRSGVAIENESEIMPGKIEDLTVHGISFIIKRNMETGSMVYVDFIHSEEIEHTQLEAKVVRCVPAGEAEPDTYRVAAKFTQLNDQYLMDILAIVNGPHKNEE
ncbi:hypothetical protein UR09_00475 [Candidatus Nitromaritima sp. SCGC AAA799-A02]|nr:hypothetical protein UR09_00475 [Candidatus Nitromaritima sp. SCGC AAA799-A02]